VQEGLFRASIVEEGTLPGDRKIETAHLCHIHHIFQLVTTIGLRVISAYTVPLRVICLALSYR
jgi:hypothetical protein